MQPGRDYLNPNIVLIVDDILETDELKKLNNYLVKWLKNKIQNVLSSLIDLKNLKEKNSSIKLLHINCMRTMESFKEIKLQII